MGSQLNKSLKVLIAIEFILIVAIVALTLINNQEIPTGYAVKENPSVEKIDFKILTKAVCEEKDEHIFCSDELFIRCDNEEYLVSNYSSESFIGCGNLKLNLSDIKINGSTKFEKEWLAPRNSQKSK